MTTPLSDDNNFFVICTFAVTQYRVYIFLVFFCNIIRQAVDKADAIQMIKFMLYQSCQ